ncbi:hypothetical protein O181_015878 [Austropuccinia psidii MF-1]|uniref:Uncharacterized protein n=1 Tax=Austropuccinia psidii MF-1 TaxID=1389203 RepID=A0A9Q3C3A2_9BASI|nr:hypothetical protein [Austropuccinia psidii MF-1]
MLILFQVPGPSHTNPYVCTGSQNVTGKSLHLSRILMAHTQFLALVQDPNSLHENTYPCQGSQTFKCNTLRFSRFPTCQMQILTLVQVPNASNANPWACPVFKHFTQLLTLFLAPEASHNSLGMSSIYALHTQFLTHVRFIVCDFRTGNDSHISGGLLTWGNLRFFEDNISKGIDPWMQKI